MDKTNPKILVYSKASSLRLQYTLIVLFNQILKVDFTITTNSNDFESYNFAKINYCSIKISEKELFIPQHTLLFQSKITPQLIEVDKHSPYPTFFTLSSQHQGFTFDVFAASFYLISRYEEYLSLPKDQLGRSTAQENLIYKNGFLNKPIVNIWVEDLRVQLNTLFNLSIPKPTFNFQPTYDIDFAWAFRQKGLTRTLGSLTKQLLQGKSRQLKVLLGQEEDPFDVYTYLDELHKKHQLQPLYFWLIGDNAKYDKNHSHKNKAFQKLIQEHADRFSIGIHPSYRSNSNIETLQKEILRLKNITGKPITKSRQHFLKLTFPETYTNLESQGILEDHTMGYADEIGFRAGIATPYFWYDLSTERITNLTIHPFQVMDVTLKQYLNKSPEEGLAATKAIIKTIHQYGGTFGLLWHNSSLSSLDGWEGWREAFEEIISFASQLTKQQNDV